MSDEALRMISPPDFIQVNVTTDSSKSSLLIPKKFQKDLTVWDLKQRLELITGRNANTMMISALTAEGEPVCRLDENYKLLGSYPLVNGHHLLVEDPMFVQVRDYAFTLMEYFQLLQPVSKMCGCLAKRAYFFDFIILQEKTKFIFLISVFRVPSSNYVLENLFYTRYRAARRLILLVYNMFITLLDSF